jgi:hypothetical protein
MPNSEAGTVVWAGPILGVRLPLADCGLAAAVKMPGAFELRFFAGFAWLPTDSTLDLVLSPGLKIAA